MQTDAAADPFVASPLRDNWYQSSAFYGSSFALITSAEQSVSSSLASIRWIVGTESPQASARAR